MLKERRCFYLVMSIGIFVLMTPMSVIVRAQPPNLPPSVVPQNPPSGAPAEKGTAAAPSGLEKGFGEAQEKVRAIRAEALPNEIRQIANDLHSLSQKIFDLGTEYDNTKKFRQLDWLMDAISHQIDTDGHDVHNLALQIRKDDRLVEPAQQLLEYAHDVVRECRRLSAMVPLIHAFISIEPEGSDFAAYAAQALDQAVALEADAQEIVSKLPAQPTSPNVL